MSIKYKRNLICVDENFYNIIYIIIFFSIKYQFAIVTFYYKTLGFIFYFNVTDFYSSPGLHKGIYIVFDIIVKFIES